MNIQNRRFCIAGIVKHNFNKIIYFTNNRLMNNTTNRINNYKTKKQLFFLMPKAIYIFLCFFIVASYGQSPCGSKYIDSDSIYKITDHDIGQSLSFINEYQRSLLYDDTSSTDKWIDIFPIAIDSTKAIRKMTLSKYISAKASNYNVVIFNEAHNVGQCRGNLISLLPILKKQGYNTCFIETLDWDGNFGVPYPDHATGYYTQESVFGELIRALNKNSINCLPYEIRQNQSIDTFRKEEKLLFKITIENHTEYIEADSFLQKSFYDTDWNRDVQQAMYIYAWCKYKNIKKYIVYCGYGHGSRSRYPNMGNVLRHITKENTLVLDQTFLRERSSSKYDYEIYKKYSNSKKPIVLVDKNLSNVCFIEKSRKDYYDAFIISSQSKYVYNRPTWYSIQGSKKQFLLSKIFDKQFLVNNAIVAAYYKHEYDEVKECAIPTDVITIENKNGLLFLRKKSTYYIKIMQNGNIIKTIVLKT